MTDESTTKPAKTEPEMRPCGDGCGEMVKPPSRYRVGHDARHASRLINEALDSEDPKVRRAAEKTLTELGWEGKLAKSRDSRNAKAAKKADAAKAKAKAAKQDEAAKAKEVA